MKSKGDDEEGEGEGEEEDGSKESSESDGDEYDQEKDETMDDMRDLPSHNEMKKELINAIEQAMREKEERLDQNKELQQEIML